MVTRENVTFIVGRRTDQTTYSWIVGFLFYVLFGNIVVKEIKYYLLRNDLLGVDVKVKEHV